MMIKVHNTHIPHRLCGILLIVCIMLSPIAGLSENSDTSYFETVAGLFSELEMYSDWTLGRKLAWITALQGYLGKDADPEISAILSDATQNQERLIDEYLLSRYGDGKHSITLNLHYCLVGELGPQHAWSLEQQAWISQLYLTYYPHQMETLVCQLPDSKDVSQEQAVRIAADALSAALPQGFSASQYVVSIMFGVTRRNVDKMEPYYTIQFGRLADDPERLPYSVSYVCYVSRNGSVLSSSDFKLTPSPEEMYGSGE